MTCGIVYPFTVNHKILSTNEELQVAVIELETSKNKWNALRAYCAMRLLSPVLGDVLYGSYVQEISKTKIAVDPFSPAAAKPYVTNNFSYNFEKSVAILKRTLFYFRDFLLVF